MFGGCGRVPVVLALATLLLASSTGCGHYGEHPKCPTEGGSPWLEVATDHFTVVSDLPREEVQYTAYNLEESLDALTQISFEHPRIPVERTTVVIFRSDSDFHAFRPELSGGTFYKRLPNDPEASPCRRPERSSRQRSPSHRTSRDICSGCCICCAKRRAAARIRTRCARPRRSSRDSDASRAPLQS
jgi:hypothetical protein